MNEKKNTTAERMEPLHIETTPIAGENRRMIATARGHEIVMAARRQWEGDHYCRELIDRCALCDTIGSPAPLQIAFAKREAFAHSGC